MKKSLDIEKKEVTYYRCTICKKCENNWYKTRQAALRKKRRCGYNPENKGCLTCNNAFVYASSGNIFYFCEHKEHPFHTMKCPNYIQSNIETTFDNNDLPFNLNITTVNNVAFQKKVDSASYYDSNAGTIIVHSRLERPFTLNSYVLPGEKVAPIEFQYFKYNNYLVVVNITNYNEEDDLPF